MPRDLPNKERIKLLVDALRSGKFEQGRITLTEIYVAYNKTNEMDCCLGVACKVAMANGLELDRTVRGNYVFYNGNDTALPDEVLDWYGFSDEDPVLAEPSEDSDHRLITAIAANDALKYDFEQIADLFEKKYLS